MTENSTQLGHTKPLWAYVMTLFTLVLLSANFVGAHSLKIFYFSFSTGTLVIQFVFCLLAAMTEALPVRQCYKLVLVSALLNYLLALLVYYGLAFPVPDFWSNRSLTSNEPVSDLIVISMFTVTYIVTALVMIRTAASLRALLSNNWLVLRLVLILFVAFLVDMILLAPVLHYIGPTKYMAQWKLLSLFSVRLTLTLFAIPLTYAFVQCFKGPAFSAHRYAEVDFGGAKSK